MRRRRFRARLWAIRNAIRIELGVVRQLNGEIDKALADRHRVGLHSTSARRTPTRPPAPTQLRPL